ncbi:NAD(P)-dependent dehydrogenase (short-subunit alcohol dehydrogenase family) [Streptomyces sp. B4I13]|nr:NAD(P)-dependent dehydrogenase (short-subunit alcohol dehydrogenase family) [Streptomyces sp. B4I13]
MTSPQAVPAGPAAPSLDLGGRTALVTGAAGGIGRACALRLAAAGAAVRGPQASFVTGTSLVLDGGWTAH